MSTAEGLRSSGWKIWRRRKHQAAPAMSLMEHLRELRKRLTYSFLAFILISIVAFFFYEPILEVIRRPLCNLDSRVLGPQGCDLIFTKVSGGFAFRLKVTSLVGIFLASPVWLYQAWAFINPGLTTKEKKYAIPFVLTSVTLFVAGGLVAYLTLPTGLRLLLTIGGDGLVAFLEADRYLNFVGLMTLGFGVMFELPIFLFFLGLVGVLSVQQLRKNRKIAVVVIAALAAVVTPSQDPYTLMALAIPLYLMYELAILALWFVGRRRAAKERKAAK